MGKTMLRLATAGVFVLYSLASESLAQDHPPGVLTAAELRDEMRRNTQLAAHIASQGYPEVAERQTLPDGDPWDNYQVTLYYLEAHRRVAFARAFLLGEPSVHLEKSEQPLGDAEVAALRPLARRYELADRSSRDPVARAEAAALRAEAAAARVDAAAVAAEQAADRADALVERMARPGRRPRRY